MVEPAASERRAVLIELAVYAAAFGIAGAIGALVLPLLRGLQA